MARDFSTGGCSMESETSKIVLNAAVSALYRRFADGALTDGDVVIDVDNIGNSARHWMGHSHATNACHQPDAEVFSRFRANMGTILDIGAHWGYTALAIRQFGTDCPIVSIEASSQNFECLDEFRKLDGSYDFIITALGDEEVEKNLYTPVVNGFPITGLNTVDGAAFSEHHSMFIASLIDSYIPKASAYKVQLIATQLRLRKLDDVLADSALEVPLTPIAAMKLDVEAYEAKVLRGAPKTLGEHLPFIMIEGANRDREVAGILKGLGYLYGDMTGSTVRLTTGKSEGVNGCYLHPKHMDRYREIGLVTAE